MRVPPSIRALLLSIAAVALLVNLGSVVVPYVLSLSAVKRSSEHVAPYTVVLRNQSNGFMITRALRSDGAFVTVLESRRTDRPIRQRTIQWPDGRTVDVDDVAERTSSQWRGTAGAVRQHHRDPKTDCLGTYRNPTPPDGERAVGKSQVKGLAVVVVRSSGLERLLSPELSCAMLGVKTQASDGLWKTSELSSLLTAEPDDALFQVPARYGETVPSVFLGLSRGSADAIKRDEAYFRNQPRK